MCQAARRSRTSPPRSRAVALEVEPNCVLQGDLIAPVATEHGGVVALPHVARSTRRSPYNRSFAVGLRRAGFTTLLFDALTSVEKTGRSATSNAEALTERLLAITRYLQRLPDTAGMPLGYLAVGEASAAALCAAAELQDDIDAVVVVGGQLEPAMAALGEVIAPVLLIADGSAQDLESACQARDRLTCPYELVVVPGATRLGEGDPRPHRRAIHLAADWFRDYLQTTTGSISRAA